VFPATELIATSEVFTAINIQVEVFWVVTPGSVMVGYWRFGGSCCLHFQGEEVKNGGNMILRNVGILSHHYTASKQHNSTW